MTAAEEDVAAEAENHQQAEVGAKTANGERMLQPDSIEGGWANNVG